MAEKKLGGILNVMEQFPDSMLTPDAGESLGFGLEGNWELVVKYHGDIERIANEQGGTAQILTPNFAILTIPRENIISLSNYTEVEYVETPKQMVYSYTQNMIASCIPQVHNNPPYNLKGEGVILGIIDSGILYRHADFRNEDGSTRIEAIWDQNVQGDPPLGYKIGTEYSRSQINEALRQPTIEEQLAIVPFEDFAGHGTHVAGIAGGNGRASNGNIMGVAPEAEFVIVKLGQPGREGFVRTVEIMTACKYIIDKARGMGKPVAINISVGMNEGSHDGKSLLELFLQEMSTYWKTSIVVATGNEGVSSNHSFGIVPQGGSDSFQFVIGESEAFYYLYIWKSFIDIFEMEITTPSGQKSGRFTIRQGSRKVTIRNTEIFVVFSPPSPLNGDEEIVIFLEGVGGGMVDSGVWTVTLYGVDVIDGSYNVWGPTREQTGPGTGMLNPVSFTSLTTPSTAPGVISVGAYNSVTNQIAAFSGRGFGRDDLVIKPDLVAPGVNIESTSNTGRYVFMSGTSMATPHVTGTAALLMEWGIVNGNNPFLYGESLKAYLLRGARRDIEGVVFPNPIWGYGKLCAKDAIDNARLRRVIL
ncbi:MAG: S8 family peptidase [Epulopiscium sp.]|nr:S8 family peptidase [Candidatus Epulonipiscium sp.]